MKIYSFEKLEVWQKARKLARDIYVVTQKFPDDEKFGLTSQLRRAAISIFVQTLPKVVQETHIRIKQDLLKLLMVV